MTSQDFVTEALKDECINAYVQKNPNAIQDVERASYKTIFKILLLTLGRKAIDVLINIIQNILINKYGKVN